MTYLETGVYRLSTLSPIHIRAGRLDYGQGFIRVGNTVYVVDTPKLQAEIFAHGGIDAVNKYTEVFSDPKRKKNIAKVLREMRYDYKSNIKKISKGIVRSPGTNQFMQSGLGEHFIPGSSIKGAMKTALLYNNVKQRIAAGNLNLNDCIEKKIKAYQAIKEDIERENFKRFFAEELLQDAFQSLHPREYHENNDRVLEDTGPFTDIFKAIKVKDATIEVNKPPFIQSETIRVFTPNPKKPIKHTLNGKCFQGETTIEISVDHEILDSFKRGGATLPFSNLNSLITLCQNFAQAQWEAEQHFLKTYPSIKSVKLGKIDAFYADTTNKERATLRVGWGTGMLGTTVSLLLDEDTTRVRLRNEVISVDGCNRPKPAPKSRRFVLENNQPTYPLGWIELNLLKEK